MSTPLGSPQQIALVGAGRVGIAVAELLKRAGHEISGVSSRRAESAQRGATRLSTTTFDHRAELPSADVLLLGVPENAIESVAAEITPWIEPGTVLVHFVGALGISPLKVTSAAGARVAALHPVQAFPDIERGIKNLPGSAWGVTAEPAVERWASDLVASELQGLPVLVPEEARPIWHAAAVSTSNGITALLAVGEAMLAAIGIDDPHRVLGPIAAGTVANAIGRNSADSLTGPVVRGEKETIGRHLDALVEASPELVEDYALIARVIVNSATRANRIGKEEARKMLELVERPPR